jgi:hypothetical protein
VSRPALRVRKSGALVVAALIALVGSIPFAGARWQLAPLLLIPLAVLVWAVRAGTDVSPDGLRVRALFGSTEIPWSRVDQLGPDVQGRVSALLTDGKVIRLTGVTTANLPRVIAAGGQEMDEDSADGDPTDLDPADFGPADLDRADRDPAHRRAAGEPATDEPAAGEVTAADQQPPTSPQPARPPAADQ